MSRGLKTIGEIFENRVFRIPDYQRGYAWEDVHRQAFWDDLELLREIGDNTHHYVGLIALETLSSLRAVEDLSAEDAWLVSGNNRLCHVVDGQQRLTTLIILLHELLRRHQELLPNPSEALNATALQTDVEARYIRKENVAIEGCYGYEFGYSKSSELDKYFRSAILEDSNQITTGTPTSVYARQLFSAKEFFRKKFAGFDNPEELSRILEIVETRLLFNVFEVQDEFDVCLTFEAINNRGKTLSDLEKLKSRLLYLSGLAAAQEKYAQVKNQKLSGYRKIINDCWSKAYKLLGWSANNILNDDAFLQLAWVLRYGCPTQSRDQHLFIETFTPRSALDSDIWPEINRFSRDLAELAAPWVVVAMPDQANSLVNSGMLQREIPDESLKWLQRISRLSSASFRPLLVAAVSHFQSGRLLESALLPLLIAVERYIFVVFGLAGWRSDTGRNVYLLEANNLYTDFSTVTKITERIVEEVAWRYDPARFVASVRSRQVPSRDHSGFYGWDHLRYALYEYEIDLHESQFHMNDAKVTWSDFIRYKKLEETVEHIYPQTPNSDEWLEFSVLDEESKILLRNSLGNLLLLSRSKNSSLLNSCFSKKAHQGNTCYLNGSFSEIAVSKKLQWTPEEIRLRTYTLLEFIGRRWTVPSWDDSQRQVMKQLEVIEVRTERESTQRTEALSAVRSH